MSADDRAPLPSWVEQKPATQATDAKEQLTDAQEQAAIAEIVQNWTGHGPPRGFRFTRSLQARRPGMTACPTRSYERRAAT